MTTDTSRQFAGEKSVSASVWQQMGNDHFLHSLLVVLLVSSIPLFLPNLTPEQRTTYGWFHSSLFLLPMICLVFWPRRKEKLDEAQRKMWQALSLGWGFWWLASCYNTILDMGLGSTGQFSNLNIDYLYLAYYLCWLVALGQAPHRDMARRKEQKFQWLHLAGSIGLAFCLFFYFILIPSQFDPYVYSTWKPSFLFYTGLDLFLVIVAVSCLLDSHAPRWKWIYSALAISLLLLTRVDWMAAMDEQIRYHWASYPLINILWISPFVFLLAAVRFRGYRFPESARSGALAETVPERSRLLGSPLVLIAIFLLVIHVVLELLDLVEPQTRILQGLVVIFGLIMFMMLAVMENRSLQQLAQDADKRAHELEQLRIQHQVEEQSQQAKSRFLANISHELRTPMNGILGMTELMLRSGLAADQQKRAELVYSSAESLLDVIDDILEYSRLDRQAVALLQREFNIEKLAEQVVALARVEAELKNIALRLDVATGIPRCLVGDGAKLQQVLMNIVNNAVKFTEEGEIRVRFNPVRADDDSVRIRCEVIDTGIGLAPGVERKLFLPFTLGDESTSRRFSGSGLGLAICRQLVETQGGRIGAFANKEKGATFWFEIDYPHCGKRPPSQEEPGSIA